MNAQNVPLPQGFRVVPDSDTKQLDETTLYGGSPARVLRLSETGAAAWTELANGPVHSAAAATLARRLTDAGVAHPRPAELAATPDVTVVIPIRDRADLLERCLAAVGTRYPVVVVDDESHDAAGLAAVAARHGATVVRRERNGGPAAARNTGLAHVSTEAVAFLDSDCVASSDWIERLAAHLADPLVGAVAPRIVAIESRTSAGRYAVSRGSLDLGEREARVVPSTRVAYVPTAALLVRRNALEDLARRGEVFDTGLRYGEDVDLVWRLSEAGWRIRYDPSVQVRHHEPQTWRELLRRRRHYGTSAAPLAQRHPTAMTHLVLQPWPTLTLGALLARRPAVAAAAFAASVFTTRRLLQRADIPPKGVVRATANGVGQTWQGVGRYGTQFAAPVLAAALVAPGGRTRRDRWGRRAAVASLLFGPPLAAWARRRPPLDPIRFTAGHIADDVAYGCGVYAGCVHTHTLTPLRPVLAWRGRRIARLAQERSPR